MTEHINIFTALIGQLFSINIIFEDKLQALTLLSSLLENWAGLITTLSVPMTLEMLKFEDVKSLMLGKEMSENSQKGSVNSALLAESSNREKARSKSGN